MEPAAGKEVQARRPAICHSLRGVGKKMEMSSVKSLAIFAWAMVLPILLIPSSLAEAKGRLGTGPPGPVPNLLLSLRHPLTVAAVLRLFRPLSEL